MQTRADALPLAANRAGELWWRQAQARPNLDRGAVLEFDRPDIGRDAYPPLNSVGSAAVASTWLGFYVIAAAHYLVSGN